MSERNLLASIVQSREAYETIKDHVQDGDISEQGAIIFRHIAEYYARDKDAKEVEPELLCRSIERALSNKKHAEMFRQLVTTVGGIDVSPANVVYDFIEVKREAAGGRLASALAAGKSADQVRPLLNEYSKWESATGLEETRRGPRPLTQEEILESLYEQQDHSNLIPIYPEVLNNRLDGGLMRGHHMLVFARPEMGKTLMMVNLVAGFVSNGHRVLYCGNEEPTVTISHRLMHRLTGRTRYETQEMDPLDVLMEAREKGYDLVQFVDLEPGTPGEVQGLIEEYHPDVVIIDQLRNLNVNEDHFVQKLEKAATAARNLGKSNNVLMVSVTQAGDSASGKGPLDMGDVDSSNTGIPAQVDVMVGIGATRDDEDTNRRILSLPKNKRSGNHEFFPVYVDPQLSLMRSAR